MPKRRYTLEMKWVSRVDFVATDEEMQELKRRATELNVSEVWPDPEWADLVEEIFGVDYFAAEKELDEAEVVGGELLPSEEGEG